MASELAVVVGVGPGLGSAVVWRCAAEGMVVVAAARTATNKLTDLKEGPHGDRIHLHDCDATSPQDVAALFEFTDGLGTPDLAVFNARGFPRGAVLDSDPAEFEQGWRIGGLAGLLFAQAVGRRMAESGRGTIVFTGATASLRGGAGFVGLAASKFATRAIAQSLARELGPRGVHVAHVIIDGQIRSERHEHLLAERGPDSLLEPTAIAETYLSLHRQHRSAWTFELDLRPWVERF